MGCVGSKRVDKRADVYQPPPASVAFFDINAMGEPWLANTTAAKEKEDEKPGQLPLLILDEVETCVDVQPQSWSEVSKALEELKPVLQASPPKEPDQPPSPINAEDNERRHADRRNRSFRTLEELDGRVVNSNGRSIRDKSLPLRSSPPPARSKSARIPVLPEGMKLVSRNSFVLRDRQEREKNSVTEAGQIRRTLRSDPLHGLPELCPPGGEEAVVLYTTTLRGVRRTFEDCEMARETVEDHCPQLGIDVDERDVSLHGEYLRELRDLLGDEDVAVPRLFVKGRYVGGAEEVVRANETGRLLRMMRTVRKKDGNGRRRGCGGCGGVRFVLCRECNGSRKVLAEDGMEVLRCDRCNENGLVLCPLCH